MNVDSYLKKGPDDNGSSNKKVLYFSDGTLEVEDDEVDEIEVSSTSNVESHPNSMAVNPQELSWFPWMWYQTTAAGTKALEVCDYVGESLASFFGITTPKYQFEINEYMKIKKAEEEENQNEMEMKRWNENNETANSKAKVLHKMPEISYLKPQNNLNVV